MYEYVRCNSCGWMEETDIEPASLLSLHAETNCSGMRGIMLPMWSVAWPYYHAPEEEKKWGLEMEWRPVGTHSVRWSQNQSGADAKQWYLFPTIGVLAER